MAENPYAPGAGTEPYRLPGRAEAQTWWRRCLTDIEGLGHTGLRGRVFTGVRGVGKTALLRYFEREAGRRGFRTLLAQAGGTDSVQEFLTEGLTELLGSEPSFTERHGRLTELGVQVGPVHLSGTRKLPGEPMRTLRDKQFLELVDRVSARAAAAGTGLVILVDEAQDCDLASLVSLCRVEHQLRRPALQLVLAGLPVLEEVVDEAITHSDRLFEYRELGNLDPEATREALLEPSAAQGVKWTDDAVNTVVELSQGYPSFIQEYGFAVWDAKGRRRTIDAEVVAAGIRQAQDNIARQYRSVWRATTPAGHEYLTAMASLGDVAKTAEVAAVLGRRPSDVTMTLRMLKERGAVRSPARGQVAFCRPG
ncbi:MAG: AAA family ATPase, partial [Actinomycetes bacterium]